MSARAQRFLAAILCGWMALFGLPAAAGAAALAPKAVAADNYQGLWWNAAESGWGINFAHQGDIVFATWFTYDATGKPWWLIAVLQRTAPGTYTGEVATVAGPPFDSQPWDGSRIAETPVGTMTVTFASTQQATIAYTVNGISQTKPITRQLFGPAPTCVWGAQPNLALATNYQDLWWNPAGESGWGVNFTHQGDIVFATWFTYDTAGKPWWLIAELHRTDDGPYTGDVATVAGPAFSAVPFDPARVTETAVGTATVVFADGNNALFTYTVNGISQSKSITRQVFVPPGTVCAVPPDATPAFDVGTTPESLLLVPGETRDVYVTITPRNGFTGPVALTVAGLPPGVDYQLAPGNPALTAGAVGARLRIAVAASATATAEPALVTVRGTAGGLSAAGLLDVGIAPSGDPIAARLATVRAVEQRAHELNAQQLARAAYLDAMAAFMAGRPGIAAAGVDVGTSTAWARYTDGTLHFVAENRDPAPRAPAASQADGPRPKALGAALPDAMKARVLQAFGPRFSEGETAVNQMRGYFQGKGWTLRGGGSGATDVGSLKGVSGDGFVYINAHGGRGVIDDPSEPESKIYAIQSSTLADEDYEKLFAADLKANRLILFTAKNGDSTMAPVQGDGNEFSNEFLEVPAVDTRYAITYRFVDAYMSFASESVVWIDACFSSLNSAFVNAFLRKGAGVYLGWSDYLSVGAATTSAPYFVDRMLGANQHPTRESPPQRAFPYDLVLQDMAKKGLDVDRQHNGQLQATVKSGLPYPPIFAPSIRYALVDESLDTLTLVGEFGPQQGKVTVGGTEIAVKSWSAATIVATLPRNGAGSSGDVVAEVRGAKSNARQLSEWSLALTYLWDRPYFGYPTLKMEGSGHVRIRADLGGYRMAPAEALQYKPRGGATARDSHLDVTASGSYSDGECTFRLSGSANYVSPILAGGAAVPILGNGFRLAGDSKRAALGLAFGFSQSPHVLTISGGSGCVAGSYPIAPTFGLLDGAIDLPQDQSDTPATFSMPGIVFALSASYGIPALSRPNEFGGTVSWTAAAAKHPPREGVDAGK